MKYAYVKVIIYGELKYWPYPEAQEFCNSVINKEDIIYLTLEELKHLENR